MNARIKEIELNDNDTVKCFQLADGSTIEGDLYVSAMPGKSFSCPILWMPLVATPDSECVYCWALLVFVTPPVAKLCCPASDTITCVYISYHAYHIIESICCFSCVACGAIQLARGPALLLSNVHKYCEHGGIKMCAPYPTAAGRSGCICLCLQC